MTDEIENAPELPETTESTSASEVRYRRLFEAARDGFIIVDAHTRLITDVNPFMLELSGLTRERFLGRELKEVGFVFMAKEGADPFDSLVENGYLRFESSLNCQQTSRCMVEVVANVYDEEGHRVVQCNVRDISERARTEEKTRFQALLLDTVGQAVIATDLEGVVTHWNSFAENLYGWSEQEAVGKHISGMVVPDTSRYEAAEIMAKLTRGESWADEFNVQRRDGTSFPAWVTNAPFYDDAGALAGIVGVSNDFSERKKLEAAQARLASIVETSNDAIFSMDMDGRILTWNRGAELLYGYDASEAVGQSFALIFPSDRLPQVDWMLDLIRGGEPIKNIEMVRGRKGDSHGHNVVPERKRRFPAVDDTLADVSLSISPVLDGKGYLIGASAIARDITEHKRAREASQRTEKLYRTLTHNFPNGAVYLLDLEGRFFLAEGRGMETIKLKPEDLLGKMFEEALGDTALTDSLRMSHARALQGEETVDEVEYRNRFRSVRTVPVRNEQNEISFVLVMSQDVTDRKHAEQALLQSEMRMQALIASIDEVVFEFDAEGRYVNIWTSDESLLALPKAKLLGHSVSELLGEEVARPFVEAFQRIIAGGSPESIEYLLDVEAGERWFLARISPIKGADGTSKTVCMLARDITERKQFEADLERSNREIRTIWESMTDAFYTVDTSWRFTQMNSQAAAFLHVDAKEIIGKNIWEEFPEAVNLAFFLELDRAVREQVPVVFEEFFAPLNMWSEVHGYPSSVGLSVYFRNINERKRSEQILRASESRFQGIVSNVPGMVYQFLLYPNGAIEFPFVSEGSIELVGLRPEEIREDSNLLLEIIHLEDRAYYARTVAESIATLEPWTWEGRGRLASGKIKWIQGVSRPRPLHDGSTVWDGLLIDITARREAEDERDRFFTLSLDMLAIVDPQGYFKRINPAFEGTLGYTSAELMAMPFLDLVHPDDRMATEAELAKLNLGVTTLNFVNRNLCRDGSIKWLSWHAVPFESLFYIVAHDITPLVEAEAALRRANEELELRVADRTAELANANEGLRVENVERQMTMAALRQVAEAYRLAKEESDAANNAKSEFLSRMSHELRTPLNAILGFGQILQTSGLAPEEHEQVTQILHGGWHLLDLISEILDISRVEAGHMELSLESISLGDLIVESCSLVRPLAAQRNVRLDESAVVGTSCYVVADRQRLKQVLINLISNGIKYNRPGGEVSISCQPASETRMRVAVRDTGPGLSLQDKEKLFTPFERLTAVDSEIEGTGLGLVLSKHLINAMGGTLDVQSALGKGSTFSIDLATAKSPQESGEQEASTPVHSKESDHLERSYTVLSIEDNIPNQRLLEGILAYRPEITLLMASNGSTGLDMAYEQTPDLVLLDLNLPDISGQQILAQLRQNAQTSHIPVIIVSADATKPQIERLLGAGATAYLTKPINVTQLLTAVDETLGSLKNVTKRTTATEETAVPAQPVAAPVSRPTSPQPSAETMPLRILVAEDNLVNQKVVSHQLKSLGHQPVVFDNGQAIVDAWQRERYDIILMDCHMPGMDGYAATREIRRREAVDEHIPIVALTANALAGDREKSLAAGMDDHLSKPVRQAELAAALMRWTADPWSGNEEQGTATGEEEKEPILQKARWDELKEELDWELLEELVRLFLKETPTVVQLLQAALGANDATESRSLAHKLKGSSSTLGAARFAALCRDIENGSEQAARDSNESYIERLPQEFAQVETVLHSHLGP